MGSEKVLESLFDSKILAVIRLFLNRKDQQLTLKEISKYSKVPLASTFRIVNKLAYLEILQVTRTKHLKVYALAQNDKTRYLEAIIKENKTIIEEFLDMVGKIDGIETVILHGKIEKDKANILIIGQDVDNNLVRNAIVSIKERHNYTITHLVLTESQYNQMAAMNLYSGKKEILLQK
ncbi:MAG: helix-turn-helix domain-containing protein [Candidatus Woesearchaeota archaeon]